MDNLKRYQICHDLITYFATLISPKKSQLGLIFRTGGSISVGKYSRNSPVSEAGESVRVRLQNFKIQQFYIK